MSTVVDGDKDDFKKIVTVIESLGHELISKHILERNPSDIRKESPAEAELYSRKVHTWIKKSDIVVFETTKQDVSLGFEVATALNLGKPVVILYRKDLAEPPYLLRGIDVDKLQVLGYDTNTLEEMVQVALEYAQEASDVRFNFFISPSIGHYLDWVSQNKKIPRSVYLRSLIDQDIAVNEEYKNE